jgi:hypothetical protein
VHEAVVERTPVAVERAGEAFRLLAADGAVIEDGVARDRFDVPELVVARREAEAADARVAAARTLAAARERVPALFARLVRAEARTDRVVLEAPGLPALHVAGPESMDEVARALESLDEIERRVGPVRHVDARFSDRLFVGPRRAAARTSTTHRPGAPSAPADIQQQR